jgi:hypothetical protein
MAIAVLWTAPAAAATQPLPPYTYKGFAADFGVAGSFPVADSDYTSFASPSVKLALHVGWELVVEERFLITPELTFDLVPVNTNDTTYDSKGEDARFQRYRGMIGARFLVRLGVGELFARLAFGVDHLTGSITIAIPGFPPSHLTSSFSSTAFGFEPGVGVQFAVIRHLVLGLMLSFPVASHDFGKSTSPLKPRAFTAADADLAAFAGMRF